jgi:hypothetical protein
VRRIIECTLADLGRYPQYAVKNGRLYEAQTLTEVWPREQALPRLWFQ